MSGLMTTASILSLAAYSAPLQPVRTQDHLDLIRMGAWQAFAKLRDEMESAPLAKWDTYA